MPSGIPVATVGVDAGTNAGLLAARIIAVSDPLVADKLAAHTASILEANLEGDKKIEEELGG
jgi:phosphoribosylcarboxyaminoimidazole (NCAIR) mutase